jgi:hypothetical protein
MIIIIIVILCILAYKLISSKKYESYNNNNNLGYESNMTKPYTTIYKRNNFKQRITNDRNDINIGDNISEETIIILYYSESNKEYQKFKSTWDNLKQKFNNNKLVILIDIDCNKNKSLCEKANITYYPTLRFIRGSRVVEYPIYKNRTYDDIIYYLLNNMI